MPTGIVLKTGFDSLFGVNAFGTKSVGAVLNTLMLMVSMAKHPSSLNAVMMKVVLSFKKAIGLLTSVRLSPNGGVHLKNSAPVPRNCSGCPTTIEVSRPAKARILGRTVNSIVSFEGLGHPKVSVTVKTNAVVFNGKAIGLRVLKFSNEFVGDQENLVATMLA